MALWNNDILTNKMMLNIPEPRRRTFIISREVDDILRHRAIADNVRFSNELEIVLRSHFELKQLSSEVKKVKGGKK